MNFFLKWWSLSFILMPVAGHRQYIYQIPNGEKFAHVWKAVRSALHIHVHLYKNYMFHALVAFVFTGRPHVAASFNNAQSSSHAHSKCAFPTQRLWC